MKEKTCIKCGDKFWAFKNESYCPFCEKGVFDKVGNKK